MYSRLACAHHGLAGSLVSQDNTTGFATLPYAAWQALLKRWQEPWGQSRQRQQLARRWPTYRRRAC
jgi:P2-related tail formation protein